MKKLLFYSLFALTLLAVPSCGDDDEDEPTTTPSGNETKPGNDTGTDTSKEPGNDTGTDTGKEPAPKPTTFTVTFDTDGGSEVSAQTVEKGKTATKPEDPTKENVTFHGWYLDDNEYDFSTAVAADITLKACYKYADAFSVSATKQVYFSKGNLQYNVTTQEWRFATNQWDYVGGTYNDSHVGNVLGSTNDGVSGPWIDLFGWGTGDNPTLDIMLVNTNDFASFSDWGTKIDDGNVWRTPTYDEWIYLFYYRENAFEKCGVAEVAGVNGLILLPDGWRLPVGLSFNSGVASDYGEEYFKTINNYSAEDWQTMESAGAVFLPAAGYRYDIIHDVGNSGYYWSSTDYETYTAQHMYFHSLSRSLNYEYRCRGCSVRLVRSL